MNANGGLFHLMLGEVDWGACSVFRDERSVPLSDAWSDPLSIEQRQFVPEWRDEIASISISRLPQELAPTPGEESFSLSDRRGAAADRHGNIYSVSNDRSVIEVQAAGTRYASVFWPDPRSTPAKQSSAFQDSDPAESTIAITDLIALESDYLLALLEDGDLLRFDLIGGGDPDRIVISEPAGLTISDIAPSNDGGAFLLDRNAGQLYRLNALLGLCTDEASDPVASLFQPEDAPALTDKPVSIPWSVDVSAIANPIDLLQLDEDHVIILDHREGAQSALFLIALQTGAVSELLTMSFDALGMVLLPLADGGESTTRTALFWGATGNQAFAVTFQLDGSTWEAGEDPELRPLRRFGGRNLVIANGMAHYDSGEPIRWVGIGVKHRCSFADQSTFVTPAFDGELYQCQWDRIRFDGTIPAGCKVTIEARAYDDETLFDIDPEAGWKVQPAPYANGDHAELPKLSLARNASAEKLTRKCWDLLLQNLKGRFAQFRITLAGDGRQSPSISAMRIWYPRFSYSRNFLPQVYSQDPVASDFTDRFLASNEGVNTSLEDRIAAVRMLFDPRTVPSEALDWLADWFDVALDPSWDEQRRRLFISHAVEFFGWRGTMPGLQLALALAFDKCIEPEDFALPTPPARGHSQIRIQEHFRTRNSARQFAASSVVNSGGNSGIHALIDKDALWQPSEAGGGLIERWAWAQGLEKASSEDRGAPFSLVAADYSDAAAWSGFMKQQIGFTPNAGAGERARWQDHLAALGVDPEPHPIPTSGDEANQSLWQGFIAAQTPNRALWTSFLSERYADIGQLNTAWASDWVAIEQIPLPHRAPGLETPTRDWLDFEGSLLPIHGSAHRFSVLIPRQSTAFDPEEEAQAIKLAERIINLEKPAHTIFDVRLFWAMNRVGEARIGRDTEIAEGSRAPQLIPPSILGRSSVGASFAGGAQSGAGGRELISC